MQTGDIGLLYHARALLTARVLSASPLTPGAALTAQVLTVKTLLSPLPAAAIRTIRGLGAQYPTLPLAAFKPAPLPILFYKPTSTIASPEDAIFIPASARGMNNDYEVEICVVLGRTAKNVSVADALSYVLGYCSSNDVRIPSDPINVLIRSRSRRGACARRVASGDSESPTTVRLVSYRPARR